MQNSGEGTCLAWLTYIIYLLASGGLLLFLTALHLDEANEINVITLDESIILEPLFELNTVRRQERVKTNITTPSSPPPKKKKLNENYFMYRGSD